MKKKKEKETISIISKYKNYCLFALLIIVVIIIIGLLVKTTSSNTEINTQIKYALEENRMVPVYKNGKYGFIDTNGNALTKVEYDYILDYNGEYAIVNKGRDNSVLDKKGKVKFTTKEDVRYDKTTDYYILAGRLYNNKLRPISNKTDKVTSSGNGYFSFKNEDNTKGGVINRKGKVVYTQELEEKESLKVYVIDTSDLNEYTYCAITRDNQIFSIINCDTGKVIKNYKDEAIYAQGNNIFQIENIETKEVESIFIRNDKIAISSKDPSSMYFLESGYVQFKDNKTNKIKYYNVQTGKTYNDEPFETTLAYRSDFEKNTNITRIFGNNKYGLINDQKVLLPCEYDSLYFFPYDLYKFLKENGKNYVLGRAGKKSYIIDLNTKKRVKEFKTSERINYLIDSTFIYYNEDNSIHVYNLLTEKENTYNNATIEIYGNFIKVNTENNTTYYNRELNKIYNTPLAVQPETSNEPEIPTDIDE